MGLDRISVDRATFERLVSAALSGDLGGGVAAIDEMALVHGGYGPTARIIQMARKRLRGVVDTEIAAWSLPVPGHLRGSTLGDPRRNPSDKVGAPAALSGLRA